MAPSPNTKHQRIVIRRAARTFTWVEDPELDVLRVYRRQGERFARPVLAITSWRRPA